MAALVGPERDADLDTVMARGGAVWLIVGARYAGNVGTAIRTAEVSGADGVYIDNDFDHDQRREARRASMRADRFLPVAWERARRRDRRRAPRGQADRRDRGQRNRARPGTSISRRRCSFVAGGEAEGVPRALLARCDVVTRIPMAASSRRTTCRPPWRSSPPSACANAEGRDEPHVDELRSVSARVQR